MASKDGRQILKLLYLFLNPSRSSRSFKVTNNRGTNGKPVSDVLRTVY